MVILTLENKMKDLSYKVINRNKNRNREKTSKMV